MKKAEKQLQLQYLGYVNTPQLWLDAAVFNMNQIKLEETETKMFEGKVEDNLRLGKLVERFVSFDLNNDINCTVLAENMQIQKEKQTLGEIDCLLKMNNLPIHLEVIYKFYLYDASVGDNELEHWIGPNRKDSLTQKLTKLKEKQLPLLYNAETKDLLDSLSLKAENIKQQVHFKAQLFLPYNATVDLLHLNTNCVSGFYINLNQLQNFKDSKFYIPSKRNWLTQPQTQVNWLTFNDFLPKVETVLNEQTAPLCWIKQPSGELGKCFVVWW